MKKLLITATLIIVNLVSASNVYCQDATSLKLSKIGVEPMVVQVEGKTAHDLYEKALSWVKETYKHPEKVLKAQIKDQKVRVDGFAENAWWYITMGIKTSYNMDYSIEVSFKDNKYRFEYIIGQFYTQDYTKAHFTYKAFFNKKGNVRKAYADAVPSLELTMNSLANDLYMYVSGKTE